MRYGYDPVSKFLFSWNGEFKFEGKTDSPPDHDVTLVTDKMSFDMMGCGFLSGRYDPTVVVWSDGITMNYMITGFKDRKPWMAAAGQQMMEKMSKKAVAICGPVCRMPDKLAEFCDWVPVSSVFICPVVDELSALGALVVELDGILPRRFVFEVHNEDKLDGEFQPFDKKLDGDGYGRMANAVRMGAPVLNEMMKVVGISPFYDRVIHNGSKGGTTFIVRHQKMTVLFPFVPVSAKMYAATTVPVRMKNTDEFSKLTGCASEYVDIVVSSDFIPELSTFMRFYNVLSGRDFVGTIERSSIQFQKVMPVFRYNGKYNVPMEQTNA